MNSSKRGCVYGFKLQSLDLVSVLSYLPCVHFISFANQLKTIVMAFFYIVQLLDTKSTDRKMTLLHYIALIVKEKYTELANFYHELHFVDKAAAGEYSPVMDGHQVHFLKY